MRKIIFLIICALGFLSCQADVLPQLKREKPDLAQIKKEVNDRKSPYYYPRLMAEFQRNDTLMKIDKYRHLYLGYLFQEDYSPYRSANHKDKPFDPRHKPTRQECDSIIADAEAALADNPFNLREMVSLINALRVKGKTNLANVYQYKLNYLLMAIVSTGTGDDKENAWYVIEPQHEYVLINMMDYKVDKADFEEPYYEYVTVSDDKNRPMGGYYFNIGPLLEEYYRKHPEELEQ